MYAADEYVNRLENIYFPILKIIKEDEKNQDIDYVAGNPIRIYKNGDLIGEVSEDELTRNAIILFNRIFVGTDAEKGAFEIPVTVKCFAECWSRIIRLNTEIPIFMHIKSKSFYVHQRLE